MALRMNLRAIFAVFALVACSAALAQLAPEADFTVGDIKIEGLQRISEGTVFNYLPVNIGDKLTPQRAARGAAGAVCHRLLPRRGVAARRQHAAGRGARTAFDRERRDQGQQGHQDRGPAEVAAQRRALGRQDLQPLDARGGHAVPHRPVLQPRQVRRESGYQGRGPGQQPGAREHRHQGRQARQDPPDQHRRQYGVQGKGHPRDADAEDAQLDFLVQAGRPLLARIPARATWKKSAPTTRIAATPISARTRCRWRSRPTRATSSSP